ncbi:hypothetical protein Pcinc_001213 [Petrolisthes cinctipes]|uniref:Uncharacterized protein n=1 Tax=Petrolisthes cinctipes TaxID=88211 RepID=A0AAE1L636_PETCI|nr:hypothetical protein Pcinc_001213 [Petrolisthes cinctipes]
MSDTQEEDAVFSDGEGESVPVDKISEAKRNRRAIKRTLTRQMDNIDKLTGRSRNVLLVRDKLSVLTETIEKFEDAQADLLSLLSDEEQVREAEYAADVLSRAMQLKEGINNWLAQYEEDNELAQYEDDNETQDEPREASKDGLGSCTSLHDLEVENTALEEELKELTKRRQQQQLELCNLRLKKERQKLIEEEKKLIVELDSYKNDVYGQGTSHSTSGVPQPRSTPSRVHNAPTRVSWEPSRVSQESPAPDESATTASVLADTLRHVLDTSRNQQRAIVQYLHVPRGEPQTFDGDELEYWPFIR